MSVNRGKIEDAAALAWPSLSAQAGGVVCGEGDSAAGVNACIGYQIADAYLRGQLSEESQKQKNINAILDALKHAL